MSEPRHHTRAVVVPLDPSAHQQRLLAQYCGARRFAYNWALGVVRDNLDVRRRERDAGVAEDDLTPAISWTAYSLNRVFNQVKGEVAPWWREVPMDALRSGIVDAAAALENWTQSKGVSAAAATSGSRGSNATTGRSTRSRSWSSTTSCHGCTPTATTSG